MTIEDGILLFAIGVPFSVLVLYVLLRAREYDRV